MKLLAIALGTSLLLGTGLQETTLRLKPKKNAVYTYTTITDVGSSTTGELKSTVSHVTTSMKVLSSTKDEVRLLTTVEDIDSNARGATDAKAMKLTYILTPLWQFKDITAEGGGATGPALVNTLKSALQIAPAFPDKPVKPGDTWTITLDLAQIFASMYDGFLKVKGEAKAPLTIKFVGIETRDGKKVATLETAMDAKFSLDLSGRESPATWTIGSTAEFDPDSGMAINQKVTQTQTVQMTQSTKLTIVTKTTTTLDSVK